MEESRQAFESGLKEECDPEDRARITNALGVLALENDDYGAAAKAYRQAEMFFTSADYREGWPLPASTRTLPP